MKIKKSRKVPSVNKRQIMREMDYKRLSNDFKKMYNVKFTVLTKGYFERRATFFYMKNKKYLGDQYSHHDYPKEMLKKLTGIHMWDRRYVSWLIRYNENNEMVIRAGIRLPESRLGLAIITEKTKNE